MNSSKRLDSDTLYDQLERQAKARTTFIEWQDQTFGYGSLVEDLRKCCALLDRRGIAERSRILILASNERAAVTMFAAALFDGHTPIMLTPETQPLRAKAIAQLTDPALVLIDQAALARNDWILPDKAIAIASADAQASSGLFRLRKPAKGSLEELLGSLEGRRPRCNSRPQDLAYVLFTSGTTSAPKGVMVTHGNIFAHLETLSRVCAYDSSSSIFNGMILAHADGLVQGPLLAMANGCRLVRPPVFAQHRIEPYLNLVRARGVTHFITVPTIYRLIDRYAQYDDYFESDEFVAMISVASKLDARLWRSIQDRFGRPVYNMYGLTETVTSALYAGPAPGMGPLGTIGKPIDMDLLLVRPDGTATEPGEPGEIWLRGENVSPGYYGDADATAEKYHGDYLKTGDVAILRPDGAYEIRGRIKNAIMYGGFLINPEEIDEVLLMHPAVVEAVSVGLPDGDFGEIAVTAVVLDGAADEFELNEHCKGLLEPMKVPKRIFPVPTIPRGDAAKPLYMQVTALLAALMQQKPPVQGTSLKDAVLGIASRALRTPVSDLSLESTMSTVSTWDSFAHINLILSVEKELGRKISTSDAVNIDSLGKLLAVVSQTS